MHDYRQRIYQHYLEAGATVPAAEKLAEFQRRAPYLERLIRDHFPEDKETVILDLGCGAGAMEYFARRQGFGKIIGIDRSPQQVAAARSLGLTGVREGEVLAVLESLASESQGLVIAFDILEHFTKDEGLGYGPGTPGPDTGWQGHHPYPQRRLSVRGPARHGDFTHETIFTRDSLEQLLTVCGFSRIECYEDQPVVHGLVSGLRWLLWRVLRGLLRFYLAVETGIGAKRDLQPKSTLRCG